MQNIDNNIIQHAYQCIKLKVDFEESRDSNLLNYILTSIRSASRTSSSGDLCLLAWERCFINSKGTRRILDT